MSPLYSCFYRTHLGQVSTVSLRGGGGGGDLEIQCIESWYRTSVERAVGFDIQLRNAVWFHDSSHKVCK